MTRKLIPFFFILFYAIGALSAQADVVALSLNDLEGTWHIKATNFPMWLNGKKTNPTFNYTKIERKGEEVLFDEVRFLKKGKEQSIVGYDYAQNAANTAFIWRGKGWMCILKSKWRIILIDDKKEWAVVQFEKTLFTPAGIDVIFREEEPSESLKATLLAKLLEHKYIKQESDLKWL